MRFRTEEMLDLVVTQLLWELPWREGCVSNVLCYPKAVGAVCLKILLLIACIYIIKRKVRNSLYFIQAQCIGLHIAVE